MLKNFILDKKYTKKPEPKKPKDDPHPPDVYSSDEVEIYIVTREY